jgi:hypothetical protein
MPSLFAPKGRAGGAGGVGSAPSEEDGGLTQQRLLILGSHLFLSLAHVFAVHQSAMESAGAEGRDENATRTYAYNPAMVVFLAELIKLVFSVSAYVHMHLKDSPQGNVWVIIRNELEDAFAERRYARFAVPALIYLIENHLRFIVLSRLASPITWVVFSHVEIPIVAALSFYFLRRRIKKHQWIAVFLLLDGVMAAEIALCHAKGDDDPTHPSVRLLRRVPGRRVVAGALGRDARRARGNRRRVRVQGTLLYEHSLTKRAALRVRGVGERFRGVVFIFRHEWCRRRSRSGRRGSRRRRRVVRDD